MPCCFLRPPSLLLVNLCPNPAAPNVHPTQQPILSSFLTLTHLFIYESLLFSSVPSSFIFNLFVGFIEVFECRESVLMQPLVYCSDRRNVVHTAL